MIKFIMPAALKEFVEPAMSTLLVESEFNYCSMLKIAPFPEWDLQFEISSWKTLRTRPFLVPPIVEVKW